MARPRRTHIAAISCGCVLLALGAWTPAGTPPKVAAKPTFEATVAPVVKQFCVPCHSGSEPVAGLDLSRYRSGADVSGAQEVWAKVASKMADGTMPPQGRPSPTAAQKSAVLSWLKSQSSNTGGDSSHVTMRRLNRFEYDNTIRDLLAIDFHPSEDFPSDDIGYGFDNIGDVLSISPLLMEKYVRAAQLVAAKAIIAPEDRIVRYEGNRLHAEKTSGITIDHGIELFTNGTVSATHNFAESGRYRIKISAYGIQAGPDPVKIVVAVAGQAVANVDLTATVAAPATLEYPVEVGQGKAQIDVSFLNDYYNDKDPDPNKRDRNMVVMAIEVQGPMDGAVKVPPSQRHIIPAGSTSADLRAILGRLATAAYRRPVRTEELNRLYALAHRVLENGDSFERSVQLGLTAILASPNFLFKVEAPKPGSRGLDGYQLASRLSYFLWSSMPDDELLSLAGKGELTKPAVLSAQVSRMLKDPKASDLADGFAAQWLELRKLQSILLDTATFPTFDTRLRNDMTTETKDFFAGVVREDRSILDFLDAKYTYVNERLAELYGIPGVTGDTFREVQLPDDRRGGLLTQASILTVTSNPNRTSPVKRGKWVLENFLGTPPPPPPPGVGTLGDETQVLDAKTLRERLEAHRKNPACATCHKSMDPIGFSLENFDAMGRWRADDKGTPLDTTGVLPDGSKFNGSKQLRDILLSRKSQFLHCFTTKLLTFALGRGLTAGDEAIVADATKAAEANGYKFSTIVQSIAHSKPFVQQGAK